MIQTGDRRVQQAVKAAISGWSFGVLSDSNGLSLQTVSKFFYSGPSNKQQVRQSAEPPA